MLELTPTLMLQAGIVFILLILLGLLWANKRVKARHQATQYRTANGTLIDKQTKAIQNLPMATRRARAGRPIPTARPTALHQVHPSKEERLAECTRRGELAALHDQSMGNKKRQASPYVLGTEEYSFWLTGYLNAPKPATVQTSALSANDVELVTRLNAQDAIAA